MKEVELIKVIRTVLERRGKGIDGDPIRRIEQYWSLDGKLLAEVDPFKDNDENKCNCIMSGYAQTTNYCPTHKKLTN